MTQLKKKVDIAAELNEVYALARDPRHWADWYVGTSDLMPATEDGRRNGISHMAVGLRFPLTEGVLDERLEGETGHWQSRAEGATSRSALGGCCALFMLACNQEWAYRSDGRGTQVEVDLDFEMSLAESQQIADRPTIEQLASRCVERSLLNLKQLCEESARAA